MVMNRSDLLNKEHVKNNPVIAGYKQHSQNVKDTLKRHAQYMERDLTEKSLNDMFSASGRAPINDKKVPNIVYAAITAASDLIKQFNFPIQPELTLQRVKNVKYAKHDDSEVVSACVLLDCKITSSTGVDRTTEIPVNVAGGRVIEPSVMYLDGREYVIAQSSVNEIVDRNTSYALPTIRDQFQPPYTKEESAMAVDLKNATGWQPRTIQYPDTQKNPHLERSRKQRLARGGRTVPTGYAEVTEAMDKAIEDGTDRFPRSWYHVQGAYIRPIVGVANENDWCIFLENDGYLLNPYKDTHRSPKKQGSRKTAQTKDKLLANFGDVNWTTYGGFLVFEGEQEPYVEVVDVWRLDSGEVEDENDPDMKWDIYQFPLDKMLSWTDDTLEGAASSIGVSLEELKKLLDSDDPIELAGGYEVLVGYFGAHEFDSYPMTLDAEEMEERYPDLIEPGELTGGDEDLDDEDWDDDDDEGREAKTAQETGNAERLANWLSGVSIPRGGDMVTQFDVDTTSDEPLYVAMIHDSSGYNPTAAVGISDMSDQDALEEAYEMMEAWIRSDKEHVKSVEEDVRQKFKEDYEIENPEEEDSDRFWTEVDEWLNEVLDGDVFTIKQSEFEEIVNKIENKYNKEAILNDVTFEYEDEEDDYDFDKEDRMASRKAQLDSCDILVELGEEIMPEIEIDEVGEAVKEEFPTDNVLVEWLNMDKECGPETGMFSTEVAIEPERGEMEEEIRDFVIAKFGKKAQIDLELYIVDLPRLKDKVFSSYEDAYEALEAEYGTEAQEQADKYPHRDVSGGEILEEMSTFIKEAKTAQGEDIDEVEVSELHQYIVNNKILDGGPINNKYDSIVNNLAKKISNGTYDPELAPQLWFYLVNDAAKEYARDFASGSDWADIFSKSVRMEVAQRIADEWYDEQTEGIEASRQAQDDDVYGWSNEVTRQAYSVLINDAETYNKVMELVETHIGDDEYDTMAGILASDFQTQMQDVPGDHNDIDWVEIVDTVMDDYQDYKQAKTGQMDDDDSAIYDYLERKWDRLEQKGWDPSVGKDAYIERNFPYVKRNLEDNPDYLNEANKKLESRKMSQIDDDEEYDMDGELNEGDMKTPPGRMYDGTKKPVELQDNVKFQGGDGPLRGKIVELDSEKDLLIIESKGMKYQVHVDEITPLKSTLDKMWKE